MRLAATRRAVQASYALDAVAEDPVFQGLPQVHACRRLGVDALPTTLVVQRGHRLENARTRLNAVQIVADRAQDGGIARVEPEA